MRSHPHLHSLSSPQQPPEGACKHPSPVMSNKSVLILLHPINFPLVLPWLVLSSSGSLAKYQLDMTLAALLQTLTSLLAAPR